MKEVLLEKIKNDINNWQYLQVLDKKIQNFDLKILKEEIDDKFYIFKYENLDNHKEILLYFHEETKEYKIKVQIGFNDFCLVEYISESLEKLEEKLKKNLNNIIDLYNGNSPVKYSHSIVETGIFQWDFEKILPHEYKDFILYISPKNPLKTINGSYIIVDYSDFKGKTNFVIYYNILREEFSAEFKFNNVPEITYDFDANNINDLANALKLKLLNTLDEIAKNNKL